MANRFEQRVGEQVVARVLELISRAPNRRDAPRRGDREGRFDYWFDGGACAMHTGQLEFQLDDGTVALVGSPLPILSVLIRFPDGRQVRIQQDPVAHER